MSNKRNSNDNDCSYLFHDVCFNAPALKEIAAAKVAICYQASIPAISNNCKIDIYVKKVNEEKEKWFNYLKKILLPEIILQHFDQDLIWYQNATINYKKTAENIVTNSQKLSDLEKFKIAAIFCLENCIEKIMPRLLKKKYVLNYENFTFSKHPLFHYWYCYYKNELHKIPISKYSSVEEALFFNDKSDNWYAQYYFLKSLKYQDRNVTWMFKKHPELTKLLLTNLDENQKLLFIMNNAHEIMMNCLKLSEKDLLWTWTYFIQSYIDREQFSMIFRDLVKANCTEDVLKQIWNDVSMNYQRSAISFQNHRIVDLILHSLKWKNTSDFKRDVLKVIKIVTKKKSKQTKKKSFKKQSK